MKLSLPSSRIYILALFVIVVFFAGCHKSDDSTTTFTPVVTTSAYITDVTPTTLQANGYITNFVSGSISAYGVCYSPTNQTPTLSDMSTSLTTANVIHFVSTISNLSAKTTYYVRGYATSNNGTTVYGNVIQLTTPTTTFNISGTATTYAGIGTAGYADGAAKSALFNSPQGVVADAAGNLYVADAFNNLIRKISATGTVTTFAGSTDAGYINGTGTAARFYSPQFLAIDAAGNLYVTDVGNNAIRKITAAGVVTTLAGGVSAGYTDGTGTAAKFYNPAGLAVDASGNVIVADRGNSAIRKITPAGVVNTIAGAATRTAGYADGVSYNARFNNPAGIAIDSQGLLYVVDVSNNCIRQIAKDTTVTTIVGNPTTRTDLLVLPVGITIDNKNNVFISDESGRILEITASKALYSIAGSANTAGFTNGSGTSIMFNTPMGLTTDAAGNVYVADYNNNVIRKLVVTTTQ